MPLTVSDITTYLIVMTFSVIEGRFPIASLFEFSCAIFRICRISFQFLLCTVNPSAFGILRYAMHVIWFYVENVGSM